MHISRDDNLYLNLYFYFVLGIKYTMYILYKWGDNIPDI